MRERGKKERMGETRERERVNLEIVYKIYCNPGWNIFQKARNMFETRYIVSSYLCINGITFLKIRHNSLQHISLHVCKIWNCMWLPIATQGT